jgi:ABC-type uncharacterized transport system ATPase subunit
MEHDGFSSSFLDVLSRLRDVTAPSFLYGLHEAVCVAWLRRVTEPLVRELDVSPAKRDAYRCFVGHVGRQYRTRMGGELADAVRVVMVFWTTSGLDLGVLEALVRLVDERSRFGTEVSHEATAYVATR